MLSNFRSDSGLIGEAPDRDLHNYSRHTILLLYFLCVIIAWCLLS